MVISVKNNQTLSRWSLTAWILEYCTNRPHNVRIQGYKSDKEQFWHLLSVPSYTENLWYDTANLNKSSEDSAFVSLITDGDGREYRELTKSFEDWQQNRLWTNAGTAKELVVDFHWGKHSPPIPVNVQGSGHWVDLEWSYKYLGVHLNSILDWIDNTNALYRKGQSRLDLLGKCRFWVQGALTRTFYVLASAIFIEWFAGAAASQQQTGGDSTS